MSAPRPEVPDALCSGPAVVPNPGAGAGVGLIHALALGGVEIATVARSWPPILGQFSRFVGRRAVYRPQRGETLVDGLMRLAESFAGRGVLFPATDLDLETMIAARARLEQRYFVPAASHIGYKIFEKNWQYEHARRVGVPTPAHVFFAGGTAPDVAGFRFPMIVKPSARSATAGDWVFRLRLLHDRDELEQCLEEIGREHAGREFQIAENIPGEPDQLYTVGTYSGPDGRVMRTYTGRKLSQFPYHHGVASLAESLPLPDTVVAGAVRLLEAMGFVGISQVEYKLDGRDGEYKLLEVNGRSWLWVKLAAFSGVNLPLIQYYERSGDARLAAALASPQRHDRFYMHDLHVHLNRNPVEQQRLREVSREKQRVRANQERGDHLLNAVYGAGTLWRRARAALRPERALGAAWLPSKHADVARASIRSAAE